MAGNLVDEGPVPLIEVAPKQADNKHEQKTEACDEGEIGHMSIEEIQDTSPSPICLSKARRIALVFTLTGAAFLNTLTVQAVVIVLPTIGKELDIPPARQQWIVSAYALTFGCFLLLWGRIADVYGKRPIFILGTLWVAMLTLINPFATNEIAFDTLRGLQGIGGAANVPTAIGILATTFPPGKARNYAFSLFAAGAPMGSVMGNLLGGVVAQYADWRYIFWILCILAFLISLAGFFVIPKPPLQPAGNLKNSVDWIGAVMITIGLLMLLFALAEGNVVGWSQPYIPVLIVVSMLFISAFAFWQLYLEKKADRRPLMKITMFKRGKVSAAVVAMAVFFSAFNSYLVYATYFYQEYQGLSTIQTTLRFVPAGVVGLMAVFVISQLLAIIPINYILMWGMACVGLACLLMAVPIPPSETYWAYGFPAMCLAVLGADTLFPSLLLVVAHNLPPEEQALGGGLVNALGQIGRAIGLAIGTAIQVAVQDSHQQPDAASADNNIGNYGYLKGVQAAQWLNVGFAAAGFVIVMLAFKGAGVIGATKKQ